MTAVSPAGAATSRVLVELGLLLRRQHVADRALGALAEGLERLAGRRSPLALLHHGLPLGLGLLEDASDLALLRRREREVLAHPLEAVLHPLLRVLGPRLLGLRTLLRRQDGANLRPHALVKRRHGLVPLLGILLLVQRLPLGSGLLEDGSHLRLLRVGEVQVRGHLLEAVRAATMMPAAMPAATMALAVVPLIRLGRPGGTVLRAGHDGGAQRERGAETGGEPSGKRGTVGHGAEEVDESGHEVVLSYRGVSFAHDEETHRVLRVSEASSEFDVAPPAGGIFVVPRVVGASIRDPAEALVPARPVPFDHFRLGVRASELGARLSNGGLRALDLRCAASQRVQELALLGSPARPVPSLQLQIGTGAEPLGGRLAGPRPSKRGQSLDRPGPPLAGALQRRQRRRQRLGGPLARHPADRPHRLQRVALGHRYRPRPALRALNASP